jgi:hypothetical protein
MEASQAGEDEGVEALREEYAWLLSGASAGTWFVRKKQYWER